VQKKGEAQKSCLVGAEAGLGVQVHMGGTAKVRAKDEIRAPQMDLRRGSRSRDRRRLSAREIRRGRARCVVRSVRVTSSVLIRSAP
jgi:hypothetical protein